MATSQFIEEEGVVHEVDDQVAEAYKQAVRETLYSFFLDLYSTTATLFVIYVI